MTLPPLPPPDVLWPDRYHGDERAYSDDAMRTYAEQAVAAERERIAAWLDAEHEKRKHLDNHAAFYAAAIRAQETP